MSLGLNKSTAMLAAFVIVVVLAYGKLTDSVEMLPRIGG